MFKFAIAILMIVAGYTILYYGIDQIQHQGSGLTFGSLVGRPGANVVGGILQMNPIGAGGVQTAAAGSPQSPATAPQGGLTAPTQTPRGSVLST